MRLERARAYCSLATGVALLLIVVAIPVVLGIAAWKTFT